MSGTNKSMFENINDLIKSLLWPFIILVLFLNYRSEFNDIIRIIPRKLESSSKISMGSLSFEIEKTAKNSGNEELGIIIKNLSEKGIRKLITLGTEYHRLMLRTEYFEKDKPTVEAFVIPEDIDVYRELERNGLLKPNEPIDNFIEFYKSLNPIEQKFSSSSGLHKDSLDLTIVELTVLASKLSSADNERIKNFGTELSESGKKAFDIIVHVISKQINKD